MALIVAAFIALQATNSAVISIMSLFVTQTLGLDVMWAGVALAVAAGLEIPALLAIGRLNRRFSSLALIASGCLAGIAYYAAMAAASGPLSLVALQVLNAWFFAVVAGVGLTLFQHMIPRPGLASGLFTNTRRLGAIVSGAIIAGGSQTALGYRGIFVACAALTALAFVAIGAAARTTRPLRRRRGAPRRGGHGLSTQVAGCALTPAGWRRVRARAPGVDPSCASAMRSSGSGSPIAMRSAPSCAAAVRSAAAWCLAAAREVVAAEQSDGQVGEEHGPEVERRAGGRGWRRRRSPLRARPLRRRGPRCRRTRPRRCDRTPSGAAWRTDRDGVALVERDCGA